MDIGCWGREKSNEIKGWGFWVRFVVYNICDFVLDCQEDVIYVVVMYLRKATRRYKDKTYTNYVLVESVRTPKGPRRRTICTLKQRLRALAPGLTPRAVLEKLKAMQMVDVHLPTTDGRHIVLPRYTQPENDQKILLQQLKLTLPPQPPPRITAATAAKSR